MLSVAGPASLSPNFNGYDGPTKPQLSRGLSLRAFRGPTLSSNPYTATGQFDVGYRTSPNSDSWQETNAYPSFDSNKKSVTPPLEIRTGPGPSPVVSMDRRIDPSRPTTTLVPNYEIHQGSSKDTYIYEPSEMNSEGPTPTDCESVFSFSASICPANGSTETLQSTAFTETQSITSSSVFSSSPPSSVRLPFPVQIPAAAQAEAARNGIILTNNLAGNGNYHSAIPSFSAPPGFLPANQSNQYSEDGYRTADEYPSRSRKLTGSNLPRDVDFKGSVSTRSLSPGDMSDRRESPQAGRVWRDVYNRERSIGPSPQLMRNDSGYNTDQQSFSPQKTQAFTQDSRPSQRSSPTFNQIDEHQTRYSPNMQQNSHSSPPRVYPGPSPARSNSAPAAPEHPPIQHPVPQRRYSDGEQNTKRTAFERPTLTDRRFSDTTVSSGRSVRWNDNLVCPSPILPNQRRKGWFNRRGDQLWTNDGAFKPPPQGQEYPLDLDNYPEFGEGWMNEESVRIDTRHRLIPKVPLRSALKKSRGANQM